ncbi:conserved hypothetical protein [Frankia sp. AiPs1]|uniref:LpqN/LpqT family lipoprotein n=1 Tax=Frankia sp. AiPa1 TaxID=573492 RepID=UPI00202B8EDF|nr:LpqN/LpqT family lipoprotein [Frankia sp. AiPa1]MCL9760780.1 LpqN/LpqT family lipoprotein [Frankia sp. AiPa1]
MARRSGGPLTAAMGRDRAGSGVDLDPGDPAAAGSAYNGRSTGGRSAGARSAYDGVSDGNGRGPRADRNPRTGARVLVGGRFGTDGRWDEDGRLADDGFDEDDRLDEDEDDVVLGGRRGGRSAAARSAPAGESMSFLRRLGVALVVLTVALGVGVGAGVVWEKVHPSGRTAASGTGTPSSAPTTVPAANATPTSAASSASSGTSGVAQVAVPSDWVAATDPTVKATFSHPPVWKQRRDNTGVFYGEPGTASEFGPTMIGVARVNGSDTTAALNTVQAGEFTGVSGLTRERSGPATDSSGQPTQELAGSYDREGQRVSYLMRTVSVNGAVYVLIARVSTSASATLSALMGALRTSFSPAA